jgi:hypothetical protein
MQIFIVNREQYADVWPYIENYMHGAAEYTYGRFTKEDILNDLYNKQQQLWVAVNEDEIYGAVVTEIIVYPRLQTLVMHFTGGKKLPRWKNEMLATLQQFARDNMCDVIESYGRPGWGKVFENDGYKARFVYYELPVEKQT